MDAWLFRLLNQLGTPLLDDVMWLASELGKGEFAAVITLVLVAVARRGFKPIPSGMILAAVLSAGAASDVIKDQVYRPRPFTTLHGEVRVVGEELRQRSFPSGHATCAFALCVSACLPLRRRGAWIVGVSLASLVAISRVYVGAHYPGDVIAGGMLGTFFGILASRAQHMLELRQR